MYKTQSLVQELKLYKDLVSIRFAQLGYEFYRKIRLLDARKQNSKIWKFIYPSCPVWCSLFLKSVEENVAIVLTTMAFLINNNFQKVERMSHNFFVNSFSN